MHTINCDRMEEFVKYFYNIKIDKTINKGNRTILENKFKKYQLIKYNEDSNELYKKYIILKKNGILCHDILLNKDGKIISNYDGKNYLLLRDAINTKGNITENELINSDLILNYKEENGLKNKWQIKNDYYEEEINKVYKDNKYIKESFDYYIGLSELAITLLNYVNFNNVMYYVQHNRLKYNESLIDYFNPINMVVDSRVRNIALYIKSNFFENDILFHDVVNIINKMNLNNDEAILFIARLLYPDYYFDLCDDIIDENYNNDKLIICIKKNVSYEAFLKKIYNYLYQNYIIPKIEFFI